MENKKRDKVNLRKKENYFLSVGLLMAMISVLAAFEWKQYTKLSLLDMGGEKDFEEILDIPITNIEQPKLPKPKVIKIKEVKKEEATEELIPDIMDQLVNDPDPFLFDYNEPLPDEKASTREVFDIVEEYPEPIGGLKKFYEVVSRRMNYPKAALRAGIMGKVYLEFIITEDGSIMDVKVVKGIGGGCDEEAVRVVSSLPKWKPGKQRGRSVAVKRILPIHFKLGEK